MLKVQGNVSHKSHVWVFLPVHRVKSQHSCSGEGWRWISEVQRETWGRKEVDFTSPERNTSRCCSESKMGLLSPDALSASGSHRAPEAIAAGQNPWCHLSLLTEEQPSPWASFENGRKSFCGDGRLFQLLGIRQVTFRTLGMPTWMGSKNKVDDEALLICKTLNLYAIIIYSASSRSALPLSALTKQQTHAGDHHGTVASCKWIKNVGCCVIFHKPAYLIGAARKGSTPHFPKKLENHKTKTKDHFLSRQRWFVQILRVNG